MVTKRLVTIRGERNAGQNLCNLIPCAREHNSSEFNTSSPMLLALAATKLTMETFTSSSAYIGYDSLTVSAYWYRMKETEGVDF